MTIIKVPEAPPAPRSLAQKVGHEIWCFLLMRVVFFWLPKASPDYDKKAVGVAYWLVEVEGGRAEREIGFDAQSKPILHAPTARNMGLWTDSDREFAVDEFETVAAVEFDRFWAMVKAAT